MTESAPFGRVIAELAGELDRLHRRRAALAEEIEGVFLAHPFGELLVSPGPKAGRSPWEELGIALEPYEGCRFRLVIEDTSDVDQLDASRDDSRRLPRAFRATGRSASTGGRVRRGGEHRGCSPC